MGIILELKLAYGWTMGTSDDNAFIDCHWLSDYANEQEVFFIGAYGAFHIYTIIDTSSNTNHYKYIRAISCMQKQLENVTCNISYPISDDGGDIKEQIQIQYRMLLHILHKSYPDNSNYDEYKTMPKYIEQLLINHLGSIKHLEFDLIEINKYYKNEDQVYFKLYRYLLLDDNGWLKMDIIQKYIQVLQN